MRFMRLLVALALVSPLLVSAASAQGQLSAREAVRQYVESLLARIEEIQPYYETDRARYFREVEEALARFVDFREVARGVMARYSTGPNGATDEQLGRFAEVFKASVVDFYGSALASYQGQAFEILPARREPSNPEEATPVRMRVATEDGGGIELQYIMFLNEQGQWKMKNLYVEGVNLRRQYYSRFDDLMARNDYDIDTVIDKWESQ